MGKTRLSSAATSDTRTRALTTLVWHHRINRTRLAEELGLTRAAVGLVVDDLIARGLVRKTGTEASGGGRPSEILEANRDAGVAIGASMSDFTWTVVATDLETGVLARQSVEMAAATPAAARDAIVTGYQNVRESLGDRYVLPAIGIGSPGLVDTNSGTIKSAIDLGWREVPLGPMVREALGIDTFVVNRSKVGALAEFWYSRNHGSVRDLVFVSIGTGIAAGIIQDGELVLGANSSAGELGHVTVVPGGPLCGCGNRGCLQTVANEAAIVSRARLLESRDQPSGSNYDDAASVLAAAENGDRRAATVIRETADHLATALAGVVNLLNPELIVLGGPVADQSPLLMRLVTEQMQTRCMRHALQALTVRGSRFGGDSSAIGAAVLVINQATTYFFS